jgi:hypothetical protein
MLPTAATAWCPSPDLTIALPRPAESIYGTGAV